MNTRMKLFAAALALVVAAGCRRPPAPPVARLFATEATSLQAPFVLRLKGPAGVPMEGSLSLLAVVETAAGGAPMNIDVEVIAPKGVMQTGGAARQTLQVGGATPKVELPLSFTLPAPLSAPITVRASFSAGQFMGAVAERVYPEPLTTPPAVPDSASAPPLPGLPIAPPTETVR